MGKGIKSALLVVMVLSVIGIGVAGCGEAEPSPQEPVELRMSTQEIEASVLIKDILVPWAEEIEEKTEGMVTITFYNNQVLAKAPEQYDAAVKGIADASLHMATYSPGRWPLSETIQLPFLGLSSAKDSSELFGEMFPQYFEDEFHDVHFLFAWSLPPTRLHTTPKPVLTLEDLQGLSIAVSGAAGVDAMKALGGIPVSVSVPERAMALERGLIDGQVCITELMWIFKMYEISKYTTLVDWGAAPFYVVMNSSFWADLPADVQAVFDDVSNQWYGASGDILDGVEAYVVAELEPMGQEFYPFSTEEEARWKEKVLPVHYAYIADLVAKGLPGQEVYDYITQFVASR